MRLKLSCLAVLYLFSRTLFAQTLSPAWIEVGENGQAIARIIVNEARDCPMVQIDGRSQSMALRQPVPKGFRPVCELAIPSGTRSASVLKQRLTLPKLNPSRIIAIGDTGCRIKGPLVQSCNDPQQWPFQQVATRAARENADLVIHVGDYLYREISCPVGSEAKCGGTPAGDNWETWDADFFTPASKLLTAAPWAFSRGNHEDCNRAWRGWFYYLDPRPWKEACEKYSAPYLVTLGAFELEMLDSSAVLEDSLDNDQINEYVRQFASMHLKNAWLVDHHPLWGFKAGIPGGPPILISVPLEAAWDKASPKGIDMILSGHVHLFELLQFDHGRPPQLVTGNGGTDLSMSIQNSTNGTLAHGANVIASGALGEFGYTLFSRSGRNWKLRIKSRKGTSLFSRSVLTGG